MPLQPQSIDIPLIPVNQKAPTSAGPAGRLNQIKNGVVVKTQQGQIRVQKRYGLAKLSNEVRTPYDGSQLSPTAGVPGPLLLTSASASTRVTAVDSSCSVYRYNAGKPCEEKAMQLDLSTGLPTQSPAIYNPASLTTQTLLSNNEFVSMPDMATVGNVRCYVWGQGDIVNQIPATTVWFEVVDLYGVQIRAPFQIGTGSLGCRIKVIADASNFWIFYDASATPTALNIVVVSGTTGQVLASTSKTMAQAGNHYDAIYDSSVGVCLAVALAPGYGFTFYRFTYASSTITTAVAHNNTDIGPGEVAGVDAGLGWLTSNEADGHVYLATVVPGDGYSILVGRLNNDGTTNHMYTADSLGDAAQGVANLGGFVVPGTTDLYVYWTQLPVITNQPIRTSLAYSIFAPFSGALQTRAIQRQGIWVSRPIYLNGRFTAVVWYPSQLSQILDPGASSALYGTQPTYFLYDIAAQQLVGSFEPGTAVADFIVFGWTPGTTTTPQPWFCMLASPAQDGNGIHLPLVALYQRFSPTFSITAVTGSLGTALSSVLIRDVVFKGLPTRSVEYASETMLPGLAAFDEGDLSEQGFWLTPEIPITVSLTTEGGTHLTPLQLYQYIFVWECLDSRGDLVQSALSLSDPIQLSGTENKVTFTFPALAYTRHPRVLVGVYRTYINALGVISTDHRAVYPLPIAPANDPTVDTFSLVDDVPDSAVAAGRPLYADPADTPQPLEYFAPPAFTVGEVFANRLFVVGPDGALYPSLEKVEGQAIAFNPELRITLPSAERIRSVAAMDGFLVLGCDASIWILENSGFPNAAGIGSLPTPQQLPFPNGMKSLAKGTKDGVFYSSSAGGIWMVGRDLTNQYVGAAIEDDALTASIIDIVVDQQQRVHFIDISGQQDLVWDSVVSQWYTWTLPALPLLACDYQGQLTFASPSNIWTQVPGTTVDDTAAIITTVPLSPMDFAGVPGLQMVWELQFLGQRVGRHTITITLFYDDATQSSESFSADSNSLGIDFSGGSAYRFSVQPANPECQAIAATIVDSFPLGATAGYTLEDIGAEVGIIPGTRKINISQRIAG